MRRRSLLRGAAVLGTAGVLSTVQGGPQPVAGQSRGRAMASEQETRRSAASFFEDEEFNFVFNMMLGGAYYGLADVGVCLAIADQITDGDAASAVQAMTAAGDRYAAIADQALAAGHRVSARDAYLQAANYLFHASFFVDRMGAPERFGPIWLRHQALWDQGTALLDPPVEHVRIAYEGTSLPGFFYSVDGSGRRRPLLLFNNGSDGGNAFAWASGIAPALQRGYNCLTFWGPGQGTALVLQQLYFRPDWERVITPIVDYALTRPDVDPARIAIMGGSQGGYWVPRAVAFEPRIAAAVADGGVWDVSTSWTDRLPPELVQLLDAGDRTTFNQIMDEGMREDHELAAQVAFRTRPYGLPTLFDTIQAARQYTLDGVVQRIRCPMLITDPEGESFWPGQSQKLYDALPGPKVLVRFTEAEGADLHCEPKAPALRAQRIFDWLDATLNLT
jgi:dienelactone hydrolase